MLARRIGSSRVAAVFAVACVAACGSAAPPVTSPAPASTTPAGAVPQGDAVVAIDGATESEPEAPTPEGEGHVFHYRVPVVGSRVHVQETMTSSFSVATGQTGQQRVVGRDEKTTIDRTVEVAAISGDVVTSVKVHYKSHETIKREGGTETRENAPIIGKTYLVEVKDGSVVVLTGKRAAAPPEEASIVQKDFTDLGKPDEFQDALPDRPIRVGERADSVARALKTRLAKGDGKGKATASGVTVRLARVDDHGGSKTGVLDFTANLLYATGHALIRMKVKGQVEIRLEDGFISSMSMVGPVTVTSPAGSPVPLNGTGSYAATTTSEPL